MPTSKPPSIDERQPLLRRWEIRSSSLPSCGLDNTRAQEFSCFAQGVLYDRVGRRVAGALDEIPRRVGCLTDHRQLRDVAHYLLGGILAGPTRGFLNNVSGTGVDQSLHKPTGAGDRSEQQPVHQSPDGADRILKGAAKLLDDLRMVVDEGQRVVDDVDDIIEIDEQ